MLARLQLGWTPNECHIYDNDKASQEDWPQVLSYEPDKSTVRSCYTLYKCL